MKTYYCVTSSFYDDGKVVVGITDAVEAQTKPKNTVVATNKCDIYNDWFGSEEEARAFAKAAKRVEAVK